MVSGRIDSDSSYLTSNYNNNYKGPIRILEIKEHTTKFNTSSTRPSARTISRVVNDTPFGIIPDVNNQIRIRIENSVKPEYIFENLDLTYKKFEPSQDSSLYKLFSTIVSSEAALGIETTEHMLTQNTQVIGFGKLESLPPSFSVFGKKQQYRLVEPTNDQPFIVTALSKSSLIERLKSVTKTLKVCIIIFGSIGAGLMIYLIYKNLSQYLEKKRREERLNQAKMERLKNRRARAVNYDNEQQTVNSNGTVTPLPESSACVVCLTNPRELVLLDCGHVCLCAECFEQMNTNTCPICRTPYRTFAPCYFP